MAPGLDRVAGAAANPGQHFLDLVNEQQTGRHGIHHLQGFPHLGFTLAHQGAEDPTHVEGQNRPADFVSQCLGEITFACPWDSQEQDSPERQPWSPVLKPVQRPLLQVLQAAQSGESLSELGELQGRRFFHHLSL